MSWFRVSARDPHHPWAYPCCEGDRNQGRSDVGPQRPLGLTGAVPGADGASPGQQVVPLRRFGPLAPPAGAALAFGQERPWELHWVVWVTVGVACSRVKRATQFFFVLLCLPKTSPDRPKLMCIVKTRTRNPLFGIGDSQQAWRVPGGIRCPRTWRQILKGKKPFLWSYGTHNYTTTNDDIYGCNELQGHAPEPSSTTPFT